MSDKPACFGYFMENIGNPNCPVCHLAGKCYEEWNRRDKIKQVIAAEKAKPWSKRRPLKELFPEACSTCE